MSRLELCFIIINRIVNMNFKVGDMARRFDLFLVAVFGFLVWTDRVNMFLGLMFVMLRFLLSAFLYERRKGSWLPMLGFTAWSVGIILSGNYVSEVFLFDPVLKGVRSVWLLFGFYGTEHLKDFMSLLEYGMPGPLYYVSVATVYVFVLWLIVYPLAEYARLYLKKDFAVNVFFDRTVIWLSVFWVAVLGISMLLPYGSYSLLVLSLPVLMLLVNIYGKEEHDRYLKYFVAYVAVVVAAFLSGISLNATVMIMLSAVPFAWYYLSCRFRNIPVGRRDLYVFMIGGICFWIAHTAAGWGRFCLLAASAVAFGYEAYRFYGKGQGAVRSVVLFVVTAFVLPLITLGYNVYSVTDARCAYGFSGYHYAPDGVMVTMHNGKYGMRDRYRETVPCVYDNIVMGPSLYLPFVKVLEDGKWGLYDIKNNRQVIEPAWRLIEQHDRNFFRLESADGRICYFNFHDGSLTQDVPDLRE